MLRNVLVLFVAAAAALWSAGDLYAQAQGFGGGMVSGQGGGGGSSSGSSGGSSFGGTSGGGGTASGSSNGSGLSMLNASTLSGSFGVLGFGAANGFGSGSGAGSMYGGRTYGSVTTAGGSSTAGAAGSRSTASTATSGSGRGGATSSSSAAGRRRSTTTGAAKTQPVWFEPRIEVGFETTQPQMSAVAASVATSLGATKVGSRFGNVHIAVDGQTATLRGMVASLNDRQLAEQIALLEPSIASVRNELIIRKPAPAPAPLPASP